jgi:serine/threonine-protein kinase
VSAPGPDRTGEVIAGKYRLHRRLGTGGMAEVWSATNRFTEKQVAIKLLGREITEKEPETKQRFLNEAKVSARIDHPNVIDIIDVGQTDSGQLFIVMELLTGVSLETALHRQVPPMTFHELAHVMIDVASALEAALASGVVHGDLKPANIFLHKTRGTGVRPTVLDFGVAKFRAAPDGVNAPVPELTLAGTVLGSPLYMSPEQARGETDVDGRADIFAFGGILYEAITGHRAFEAKNFNALIVKIATTRPKSIDEEAPQVPDSLRKVVRVCLEPDLEQRAKSFTEVLALLRAAVPDLAKSNQRLPALHLPPALLDPERTNAMPVFAVPEHTRYEAALAPRARESSPPSPWLVVLAGALVIGALAFAARARPTSTPAMPPPSASAPPPATELVIASSPSACRATVDGVDRGDTPVTIVTPGDHDVSCKFANGQIRTTKLTLTSGTSSRYRFFLAE